MGTLHCIRTCTQKKSFLGFHFKEPHAHFVADVSTKGHEAEAYLASTMHASHGTESPVEADHHAVPHNLPTAQVAIGYAAHNGVLTTQVHEEAYEQDVLSVLENQAHLQKVLLSSDAMRYFIAHVTTSDEQTTLFAKVIAKARTLYPTEDGWVVVNLQKMEHILEEALSVVIPYEADRVNTELENSVTYTPMTAGSLAEAIILKDTALAFMLASDRPMIALADAVSDLNAVCAHKKGEQVTVSNFLMEQTALLSQDTLEAVLQALTTAIDGTYSEEEQAVKMAITKAIAVLPQ